MLKELLKDMGVDKIITISTSKIKNKSMIVKKCEVNGLRGLLMEVNPHSKGDVFSLVSLCIWEEVLYRVNIMREMAASITIRQIIIVVEDY
jgi:hypothetical protein